MAADPSHPPDRRSNRTGASPPFHALSVADVLAFFAVSARTGLAEADARRRLAEHGANLVAERRRASALMVLLHQFASPVVYLLGAAAALALYFHEWRQALAIGAVLALNAAIGFVTELKAARSIEALRSLGAHSTRVRRDGRVRLLPADRLVPGDIVVLDAGDAVSADLRLVESSNVAADESTLTGESAPVEKAATPVPAEARLADRASMLFKGTAVTRGAGLGVVVATGQGTELGRVSRLVEDAAPGQSPIEKKLARLSGQLIWATLALAAALVVVGLATGKQTFLMVETAIALAVAAIPEGLPIVATLALARGMWRMARQNALVERLSAVETLGATTVILTDKTGTLTENRMTVRRLWLPSGEVELGGREEAAELRPGDDAQLAALIDVAALCNDASLDSPQDEGSGDPMELALLRLGWRAGASRESLLSGRPVAHKHAFDAATKMMASAHAVAGTDSFFFAVKGAPEAVIAACDRIMSDGGAPDFAPQERAEWRARVDELGRNGLRVIACATKLEADARAEPYRGLTFIGLIGLEDPARADVPQAIRECQEAGIRVVMVTGDHAVTARSIANAVGLARSDAAVVEGSRIDETGGADPALLDVDVFARVTPSEKLALVRAHQANGEVVAMTGDGVNDAPALRRADIGVAMGLRGTDVARQAAAMILLDDAFPTIVNAIREGRAIFGNIRRFAAYLLSCNLSEVLVVGAAVFSTLPLPLLPLQILYLNLVTDVLPAFALALGEGERDLLKRPPRRPQEPILGRAQWAAVVLQGAALTAATFAALGFATLWLTLDGPAVVTVAFLTLGFAQLWHVFDMRSARSSALRNEITRNPWIWAALAVCAALLAAPPYLPPVAQVLELVPPTAAMWTVILAASLAPMLATQAALVAVGLWTRRRAA